MQIILLKNISKLGNLGDIIHVKPGYARNFLIPYQKAILATKKNLESLNLKISTEKNKTEKIFNDALIYAQKINLLQTITLKAKASKEGKLFGSIGTRELINHLATKDINLKKDEICFPNGTIRTLGEHKVNIKLHNNLTTQLLVNIIEE
uniref:Large ribosomal subunit protein bL9 n=1 Tax=Candidatus Aschnera chinzeii TaxID=1485666 RepID=A0AAT9G438_9ENTR|nr:MAG: 50S ribosomal protein L9 [Candidatus Aschnera chinzeii]